MPTVEFKRDLLFKARDRGVFTPEERAQVETLLKQVPASIHTIEIRLEEFPDRLAPSVRAPRPVGEGAATFVAVGEGRAA